MDARTSLRGRVFSSLPLGAAGEAGTSAAGPVTCSVDFFTIKLWMRLNNEYSPDDLQGQGIHVMID
jgi:hypothetical protein